MKKILVPCDFSELTDNAVRFAIDIANKSGGEIILLHIIESSVKHDSKGTYSLSGDEEAYLAGARGVAEKRFGEFGKKWEKSGPTVNAEIRYGMPSMGILDFVKDNPVDLIVMGTKGFATGIKEIIVGSTTERIIRNSLVPVMTVKKYLKNPIKNIVLANSLLEDYELLVKKVNRLRDLFDATIHIVHITYPAKLPPDHEIRERLNAFATQYKVKDCTISIYNDLDPESGLINFAKSVQADMVAMVTHGRKGLSQIVNGSIAESVGHHVDCPMLTVKI